MRPILLLLLVWTTLMKCAQANTEIINFQTRSGGEDARSAKVFYPPETLDMTVNPRIRTRVNSTVNPELKEYKIGLLLSQFTSSSKASWTARVSYPATTPADFTLKVIPWNPSGPSVQSSHDRLLILTHTSAPIYLPPSSPLRWGPSSHLDLEKETIPLIFDLIIEPLTFGVVPETAWPAIFMMIPAGLIGWGLSGWFLRDIDAVLKQENDTDGKKQR